VDPDANQPFRYGKRYQPLRRLSRNAQFGSDLVLRIAGYVIEPASARGVVKPRISAILTHAHDHVPSFARPISQQMDPCAIVCMMRQLFGPGKLRSPYSGTRWAAQTIVSIRGRIAHEADEGATDDAESSVLGHGWNADRQRAPARGGACGGPAQRGRDASSRPA